MCRGEWLRYPSVWWERSKSYPCKNAELGISLVETLIALLLLSLVVHAAWAVFATQRAAVAGMTVRAEGLETIRTVGWILPEELAEGERDRDWFANGDTVVLRAFRGLGLVLGPLADGRGFRVCYRGLRNPAPEKDSVLILGADGLWRAYDLTERSVTSVDCPWGSGVKEEAWRLHPEGGNAVVARIFERGSYHLASGALRYRRGEGGRQPLTAERILEGSIETPAPWGAGLAWQVVLTGEAVPGGGGSWRGSVW